MSALLSTLLEAAAAAAETVAAVAAAAAAAAVAVVAAAPVGLLVESLPVQNFSWTVADSCKLIVFRKPVH